MKLSITFLGTGTSTGIPMLGCECDVCMSSNPLNKRLRTSFLLQGQDKNIVFDTGPDIRTQLLREDVKHLDAIIISHEHADHLNGIDDVRPYTFKRPIELYTSHSCAAVIKQRFGYVLGSNSKHIGSSPRLHLNELDLSPTSTNIAGLECKFFNLPHGNGHSLGMYTGAIAIISDCHEVPSDIITQLKQLNLEALIIDCVRENTHPSHLNVENCFSYIKLIGAKKNYLTHMGHELDHDTLQSKCNTHFPDGSVKVAYDGLKFTV